jgi:hypothetical protein
MLPSIAGKWVELLKETAPDQSKGRGVNLTTLDTKKKYGTKMSNEDRRAKLSRMLESQKRIFLPGYVCPKTEKGNEKSEGWVKGSKSSLVFFVKCGHSELELAPGMKGISIANKSDIPAVIDHIISIVSTAILTSR